MTPQAEEYLSIIRSLLRTKKYEWAKVTLLGIYGTVSKSGELTLRQKEAIEHIIVGRLKHDSQ